ncbi:MAG: hypothetical protein HYZ43_17605 [Flavobacteriia bacterium]|nr:hypothetical protein [Flavobacteriia bacterium]
MKNGLSTIQKFYRLQRIAVIFFLLMMVVSLLLPYTKVDVSTLYVPSVFTTSTTYGHEFRLALTAVFLALICTLLITITKTRIPAIIAFFVAVLGGILLLILPQEIHFRHVFIKPSGADYTYQIGFFLMIIGGICIIITAFVNLLLVAKNAQKDLYVNSELIDDL